MLKHLLTRPVRVLAVTAAALLAVALTSQAATAAPGTHSAPASPAAAMTPATITPAAVPSGCSATFLCFWVNINFNGGPGKLSGNNSSWFAFSHSGCQNGTWADCASSLFNDGTQCTAHVYFLTGFGHPELSLSRGTGIANLVNVPLGGGVSGNWNDNIESNNWC